MHGLIDLEMIPKKGAFGFRCGKLLQLERLTCYFCKKRIPEGMGEGLVDLGLASLGVGSSAAGGPRIHGPN